MSTMDLSVLVKLGDRISAPLRAVAGSVGSSVGRMQGLLDRVNLSSVRVANGLALVAQRAKGGIGVLAGYKGALMGYNTAMAGLALNFIGPAAEMERFKVQLTNLEGSSAGAEKAMAWISDFATRTPLEMNQTVAAYARLKAFGVDPMNGSLQAMVDTMAATGGGAEQLDGLVMALGQSWTKGKLQSEEALQMLERGVPVWDLLAAKMGKSAAEVQELATKGKLGREEITLLIEALGEKNAGASEGMSKTWDGIISNIRDTWTRFQLMVMNAGVFDSLKRKLQDFLTLVNQMAADGRLQAYADALATNILAAIDAIWTFGKAMVETWQVVVPWLEMGATAVGGWENFIKIIAGGAFVSKVFGIGTALGVVAKAVRLVTMALIANPIIAIITAIAVAAYLIYQNWDAIAAWFANLWNRVTAAFSAALAWTRDALRRWTPDWVMSAWSILTAYFRGLWDGVKQVFRGAVSFITGVFNGDMSRAASGLKQIWTGVKTALTAVFTGIGDSLRLVWDSVLKPVMDKLGATEAIAAAWNTMKEALGAVIDWLGERFAWLAGVIAPVIDGLRWVRDSGAAALEGLGLTGGDAGPGNMPATDATGAAIPQYAGGGSFGSGPIIVGENGPELRYEGKGGFIAHNRALREMARLSSIIGGSGVGAGMASIPASLAARNQSFSPTYAISLTTAPGQGSPAELEAMIRRVLAEEAARATADLRRVMHD